MSGPHQVAVIDCQTAGVSGDMILGALLDLGANVKKVVNAMESVGSHKKGCKNLKVIIKDVNRRGFRAKKVDIEAEEEEKEITGIELLNVFRNCVENLELSQKARQFALCTISTLLNAEANLHGKGIEGVHLHESGSIDTLAEIIGSAVALDDLGLFDTKIYSTPVSVGGGKLSFSHGTLSSPAPATIGILSSKEFPMIGGPIESELATPTGVSLLVNLVHEVVHFYPPMKPTAVGYGAGAKNFAEIPNILRITLGKPLDCLPLRNDVFILETNLDDVSGEIIGHAVDRLLREGAKDVSIIPIFMKKNRPGHILKIISDRADVERLSRILMEETGTLGVRIYSCERRVFDRELFPVNIAVNGAMWVVNVKVARDGEGKIILMKPEFEDAKRIAEKTDKPIREIMELARVKAEETMKRGNSYGEPR
jgi:uncharacterized protein (TIGR00299 family) protein